jgi:hypothetical protein
MLKLGWKKIEMSLNYYKRLTFFLVIEFPKENLII